MNLSTEVIAGFSSLLLLVATRLVERYFPAKPEQPKDGGARDE
ncbi:hypothetical protein ACFC1T_09515 [Kitasatospora sp. NPDC056076]